MCQILLSHPLQRSFKISNIVDAILGFRSSSEGNCSRESACPTLHSLSTNWALLTISKNLLFQFNTFQNALARCPHCRKVSSVGPEFRSVPTTKMWKIEKTWRHTVLFCKYIYIALHDIAGVVALHDDFCIDCIILRSTKINNNNRKKGPWRHVRSIFHSLPTTHISCSVRPFIQRIPEKEHCSSYSLDLVWYEGHWTVVKTFYSTLERAWWCTLRVWGLAYNKFCFVRPKISAVKTIETM